MTATVWLYCITEGPGQPVKIGVTHGPRTRIEAFRPYTWRDVWMMWAVPSQRHHEHKMFALLKDRRIRAEWFRDPDDELKALAPFARWFPDLRANFDPCAFDCADIEAMIERLKQKTHSEVTQ